MTQADRVAEAIADRIRAGEFRPGDRLPSMNAVAEQYGVSYSTGQSPGSPSSALVVSHAL